MQPSVAGILKGFRDRFGLCDKLGVKRRRNDVPAFLSLLESENKLPVAYCVLLHHH